MKNYVCSICGKEHVKLWRPYMYCEPLVCAECAEKHQTSREYSETIWEKKGDCYKGTFTGKKLPLPKWKVNEEGRVPSYDGPGPEGVPPRMTDQLIVCLPDETCTTNLIPAVPHGENSFWGYTSVTDDAVKWWQELSTR